MYTRRLQSRGRGFSSRRRLARLGSPWTEFARPIVGKRGADCWEGEGKGSPKWSKRDPALLSPVRLDSSPCSGTSFRPAQGDAALSPASPRSLPCSSLCTLKLVSICETASLRFLSVPPFPACPFLGGGPGLLASCHLF